LGYQAGYSNQTGAENTYIGHAAGYTGTGSNNCFVGQGAGYYATGTQNTYIGKDAGVSMTSGSKNVIIGKYTGNNGGLDIRTSSNNIVLSDGDGNPMLHLKPNNDIVHPSFFAGITAYSGDLNSLFKTGFYRSENTNANNPTFAYYAVIVYGNQGNVTSQIATVLAGTETYVRSYNTSWTAWQRLDT
jgi:hypothetical protein